MVECRKRAGTRKKTLCVHMCVCVYVFDRRSMIRLQFLLAVYPHYCCQGAYQLNWANSGPLNKLLALFEEGNQIRKLAQIQHCTAVSNSISS